MLPWISNLCATQQVGYRTVCECGATLSVSGGGPCRRVEGGWGGGGGDRGQSGVWFSTALTGGAALRHMWVVVWLQGHNGLLG